jgi:hypothetical protein
VRLTRSAHSDFVDDIVRAAFVSSFITTRATWAAGLLAFLRLQPPSSFCSVFSISALYVVAMYAGCYQRMLFGCRSLFCFQYPTSPPAGTSAFCRRHFARILFAAFRRLRGDGFAELARVTVCLLCLIPACRCRFDWRLAAPCCSPGAHSRRHFVLYMSNPAWLPDLHLPRCVVLFCAVRWNCTTGFPEYVLDWRPGAALRCTRNALISNLPVPHHL